jgi:hypothetical protein
VVKLPTEFRTSFTIHCDCDLEWHGTISTTGFRYLPVSRIDEVSIDFSKAVTTVRYENDVTECPLCRKILPTQPEKKGDDEKMGGRPNPGTKADQRLKTNNPTADKPKTTVKPAPAPMKKGK